MITTDLDSAKAALMKDDIIAIPTETVYGLAGNAYSETALQKIFALKKRPTYNPLIVHIKSIDFLEQVAREIPLAAIELAKKFWPGPLTLILKKQPHIPDLVTAGKETVGVRMPKHPLTLQLLSELPFPLAAPSANPFGSISPSQASHVFDYFGDSLDVILDGGPCQSGIESTIIGFEQEQPTVYRLGALSLEDIENTVGPVFFQTHNDTAPTAPGMLSRHYAPDTETYLSDDVQSTLLAFSGKKIGVLLFKDFLSDDNIARQEVLSESGNMDQAAQNLYAALHRLDKSDLDIIIVERLPDEGLGRSINDRLQRATKKA